MYMKTSVTLKDGECIFCFHAQSPALDETHLVIKRYTHVFVLLNLFPYNPGHLLVIPYQHAASLTDLLPAALHELIEVTAHCLTILKRIAPIDGFNIGSNLEHRSAGGSIPDHLHMHVLPRWQGDTSFLTTLAQTRPISKDLHEMYRTLRTEFEKVS
jgi:ATP adenylyltransferase